MHNEVWLTYKGDQRPTIVAWFEQMLSVRVPMKVLVGSLSDRVFLGGSTQ